MNNKVILAFSGGLDTTFSLVWLQEQGYEVYTVFVNTGGMEEDELATIKNSALKNGAVEHFSINAEAIFFDNIIKYIIKFNALYEDDYPLMCTDRYIISEEIIKMAVRLGAGNVAHGCTNIGNDQIRFDSALKYFLPDINIIKPIKSLNITRGEEIDYLNKKGIGIELKYSKYSINQNVLGCTVSGSEIDLHKEPTFEAYQWSNNANNDDVKYLTIDFQDGVPYKLNDVKMSGIDILKSLNVSGSEYSIGNEIYAGDCIIGIKGRIMFEAPGIFILMKAWKKVMQYILTKEQISFVKFCSEKWSSLVYSGLYYEPLCRNLESLINSCFSKTSAKVVIKLTKNKISVVEVISPDNLFAPDIAVYAQKSKWTSEQTDGFINFYTLQQNIAGARAKKL